MNEEKLREYLRRVTADLHETRQRLRRYESGVHEPVAIVGLSCRLPGGIGSADEFWQFLLDRGDAIGGFPADRGWRLDPGEVTAPYGGFLDRPGAFDAELFGMSPREALATDPQQRLLLEASWEALESATIAPFSLRGTRTGVFAGVMYHDYGSGPGRLPEEVQGYLGNGTAGSVASGRVAYTLGLEGPAVTVDTACSSSLVGLHLAAQALRQGECDLALAGGVTVMATPAPLVDFSRQRGLATDGRCKPFSAAADGTALSEGIGMLVLERLSDATRNGRSVLAVLRGSAVNQDGASSGLTAPNGPSQQRVIRAALASAGLGPEDVDVVEAHGTGTRLGDPIEAQALQAAYGKGRDADRPLLVGGVKSNVGHTQAAAGVTSVIKMIMAMRHGVVPATLHCAELTGEVEWDAGGVEVVSRTRPWPSVERPRRAAVSSFGISGTNAHVVLEQPALLPPPAIEAGEPWPILLSARSEPALRDQAARLAPILHSPDGPRIVDVAHTLLTGRSTLEHRAVVLPGSRAETVAALETLARGASSPRVVTGEAAATRALAFLFTGQGSQHPGMGAELYSRFPVYAMAFDEVCARFEPHVRDAVLTDPDGRLDRTDVTQAALFAVEVALYRLVTSFGVRPDFVTGHSIGEITAAHVAGILDLDDACALVAARGRLMASAPGGGAMIALQAREDEIVLPDGVSLAAVNGPGSVVVSGDAEAAEALAAEWAERGRKTRRLRVSHAFHSPHMEPILDEFRAAIAGLTFRPANVPVVSNVTGTIAGDELRDPDYWVRHVRATVRFGAGIADLAAREVTGFLELGPGGVLTGMAQESIDPAATFALPAIRAGRSEAETLLTALARLHCAGVPVDWSLAFPGTGRAVPLPPYAFQHRDYWLLPGRAGAAGDPVEHPLLDTRVTLADGTIVFDASWEDPGWLLDHAVGDRSLVPGAVLADLTLFAAGPGSLVRELVLEAPILLDEPVEVQIQLTPAGAGGTRRLTVHRRTTEGWIRHAQAELDDRPPAHEMPDPPQAVEAVDLTGFYAEREDAGFHYGPAFRGLRRAWRDGGTILAELELTGDAPAHGAHPALLDAAVQAAALVVEGGRPGTVRLPFAWSGVRSFRAGGTKLRARVAPEGDDGVSIALWNERGEPVAVVDRVTFREVPLGADVRRLLHVLAWRPAAAVAPADRAIVGPAAPALTGDRYADLAELAHAPEIPPAVLLPVEGSTIRTVLAGTLAACQQWLAEPRFAASVLTVVTRAAVRTASEGVDLTQAGVPGLIRSAQREHPGRFALLDLDADADADADAPAVNAPEAAVRHGMVLTPAVVPAPPEVIPESDPESDPDNTVLITGGTGTIGRLIARHLAATSRCARLILTGRHATTAQGLDDLGVPVELADCDITDPGQVAALVGGRPITTVVHAAGVTEDHLFTDLTAEHLDAVLGPKADGARILREQLPDARLILFSSIAGVLGSPGQAAYAAANAILDALAGDNTTTIAWGLWAGTTGMTAALTEADRLRMRRAGVLPLSAEDGLALFEAAAGAALPNVIAARLAPATAPEPVAPTAGLLDLVRRETATILGHSGAGMVPPDRPFKDLGFDSLTAVELRNRLAVATGRRLPATLTFDYPTPAALAAFLDPGAPEPSDETVPVPADEPIAIVGMACRLPGDVRGPDDLWRLLVDETDAIGPFPADRGWDPGLYDPDPDATGRTYATEGGFLYQAGDFDAEFFGISPREALAMDPQQRLLLETSWESLEHAGIEPATIRGSRTGVFTGLMYHDYVSRVGAPPPELDGFLATGNSGSVASGRIAYVLGLEGPAVSLDTACSSSLVATHLAAQSLRSGESTLALAGGVTVMAGPETFIEFSRQRGLAPDGRCKAFSDQADGTGWSEGVGVLVLERLSDAQRNGHQVWAVIRGSAVNQDGASNGLTAPNGPSQQRVIRQALANARLEPADIDAIEAHGTGTRLGDPIEAQALIAVFGDHPVHLGSLKSNIGHTQAAAGVAAIIKMTLALRHGHLPRTLHADEPSSHVDWETGNVALLTKAIPWSANGRPRRAGVSSFGVSGTNAHLVLEEAPVVEPVVTTDETWFLSAKTSGSLRAFARQLFPYAEQPAAVAAALAKRSRFAHRAAITGRHEAALSALSRGEPHPDLIVGEEGPAGKIVFVYPGQGAQWTGMADLVADEPALDDAVNAIQPYLDYDLRAAFTQPLERVDVVQPALFVISIALTARWQRHGITPDAVIGHSQGEIPAAVAAGILTLDDAARLVATRSHALTKLIGTGGMASINAAPSALERWADRIDIAAINSPDTTVISGPADVLAEIVEQCKADGIRAKILPVDYPSHGRQIARLEDQLQAAFAGITHHEGRIPLYSTVTGRPETSLEPGYWYENLRNPVQFHTAVTAATDAGHTTFIEISPHPILTGAIDAHTVAGSLTKHDAVPFAKQLAAVRLNHPEADRPEGATLVLPTYQFEHRRYWLAPSRGTVAADAVDPLRYRIAWRPVPAPAADPGRWMLITDRDADDLRAALPTVREIRSTAEAAGVAEPSGVLIHRSSAADVLATLRSIAQAAPGLPIVVLTRAAVSATPDDRVEPAEAAVWGMGRVAALELPESWGGLIDLPPVLDDRSAAMLRAALAAVTARDSRTPAEDQLAVRPTGLMARRLTRMPRLLAAGEETQRWQPDGAVLVTGATGPIGRRVARWLAARGAKRLLLAGNAPAADAPARNGLAVNGSARDGFARELEILRAELTEAGAEVVTTGWRPGDRAGIEAALAGAPITAVFHAAQPRDAAPAGISELDEARLRSELDALAGDAALLDELTAGKPLTAFVVATSIMGIWGAGGFGAHAAGHAAAEAIVQRRRAAGRPAASVAWGPVPDGDAEFTAMVRRHGVPELTDDDVTAVLDRAVDDPGEDVIAARIDWRRFATAYTAGRPSPLLTEIDEARVEQAPVEEGPVEGPADLPGLVRREVAAVLGYEDASAVPPDKAFKDLGFDSVRAVELRNRIRAATGLELSAALVFDYPSPAAVASHLAELTGGAGNRPLAGGPAEHLDLVSAAVSGMDAGERERTAVRLRRLLTELETAGDNGIDRTATDLTGASADEVLAFIDREFGASGDPAREG